MYIPPHFAETDPETLHAFFAQHSFATLVSQHDAAPYASHLPLLFDRTAGPHGRFLGHMARANPQWQSAAGQRVLAIFHGPHAYISPTWYEAANVVPTWNYVAVHVTGTLRLVEDRDRLLEIIRRTVETYESPQPRPWSLDLQDATFIDRLLALIVGFEIAIDRIEGKWKLNQNHDAERRQGVIRALEDAGGHDNHLIAELMRGGTHPDDDLRPEYDLSTLQGDVRGKHLARYRAGTNLVLLAPDVRAAFPTDDAVNEALRSLMLSHPT